MPLARLRGHQADRRGTRHMRQVSPACSWPCCAATEKVAHSERCCQAMTMSGATIRCSPTITFFVLFLACNSLPPSDSSTAQICGDRRDRTNPNDDSTFTTYPQMRLTFWLHEPTSKAMFEIFGPLLLVLVLMLVRHKHHAGRGTCSCTST